jgi:nucleoid-associated protein EbfC
MLKNNFSYILKHAQKVQEEISKVQAELEDLRVTGTAGGGMVEVTANGRQQIINIKIQPEIVKASDVEMLEDIIAAAVNQAMLQSQELANEQMNKITGGLLQNLPEGIKIPGLS